MLVSVIIPTYKGASFIPYLLESLRKQRFKDFEIVKVIKPSGDGTEQLVRELCNKFNLGCKILIQREGYFPHALNMGLKNSKGELILFTDDDAILPENWIESHIDTHKRFKNAGAVSGSDIPYLTTMSPPKTSLIKEQTISKLRRGWQFVKPILNKI
jgi:glycosyltransferase involved in cell wall biosynthesis